MSFDLQSLVRKNILELKPYSSARSEYSGNEGVFLDANENPFGVYNRYPDPYQRLLKQKLSEIKKCDPDQLFIGNGSDEVIDIAFRIFCNPGKDKALTFSPTYGMYEVSAAINNVEMLKIPLDQVFQIDIEKISPYLKNPQLKLIFICSPNNPTGNLLKEDDVLFILKKFKGIVIIDEAYIDFAKTASWVLKLNQFPNLIVSQTLSKAWGLAGVRLGIAMMNKEILKLYNKVKPPYNISAVNQETALNTLKDISGFQQRLAEILKSRDVLIHELKSIQGVQKIYPSDANFLLIRIKEASKLYEKLTEQKIIVRNRSSVIRDCLRITVGTKDENQKLITALKEICNG